MRTGRKHYKDAREPLTRATRLDGRLFEAWHDLGVVETALGNFEAAADDFKRALDIQPGARQTVLAYGESLRRSKNGKKAGEVYARWLTSDPNDFEMRARYSQVLREAGEQGSTTLDESLEQARLLLTEAGGDVSHTVIAYNALALTYYKMGKFELAETALHKASDLDPKSAFVWNNLGLVAFERGHDQEAFLDFQKASELDPKYVQARLNKAVVYLDCGDYKKARADLEKAVEIDPNDAESQVALGVASRGDGKLDQARKAYERALDIEPDYPPALYDLGRPLHGLRQGPGQGQGPPRLNTCRRSARTTAGAPTPSRGSRSSSESSRLKRRLVRSRWRWPRGRPRAGQAGQATRGGPPAGARSRAGAERGPTGAGRRRRGVKPRRRRGLRRSASDDAKPAGEAKTGGKNVKTKTYTFGAMDVEGKLKTPQLLYFLNRVKLELDMSAPDKRSFMKELGQSADDKSL